MSSNTWKVTVTDVDERGEECFVEISLDDGFMEKFKRAHGMKRWSDKRFSSWFVDILKKTVATLDRKDRYDVVYNQKDNEGSVEDAAAGDLVEYLNKDGATYFREIAEVVEDRRCKAGKKFRTAPLMEGDCVLAAAESVPFDTVLRIMRNKS